MSSRVRPRCAATSRPRAARNSGSQSYVPTDEKDDRALKEAFDLLRGTILMRRSRRGFWLRSGNPGMQSSFRRRLSKSRLSKCHQDQSLKVHIGCRSLPLV